MKKLWVKESFINATEDYRFGDSGPYETAYEKPGDLYRWCVAEYGRCISKVHVDRRVRLEGGGERWEVDDVGWVFQKLDRYGDTGESYLREVWVTVLEPPEPAPPLKYVSISRTGGSNE